MHHLINNITQHTLNVGLYILSFLWDGARVVRCRDKAVIRVDFEQFLLQISHAPT